MKKIDWEKLAKQLQEALAKEMKENERLKSDIEVLNNELEQYVDDGITAMTQRLCKDQVIAYLERRLFEEIKTNEMLRESKSEIPF